MYNKLIKIAFVFFIFCVYTIPVFSFTLSGSGTEANPYLIYNIDDLREVADSVNKTNIHNRNLHFKLMADIPGPVDFFIGHNGWTDGINIYPSIIHRFTHHFDGNGYTIILQSSFGVFHYTEERSVIKNLIVDGEIDGSTNIGGIVGVNLGLVENCINYASVNATLGYAGGIAGINRGTIIYCSNYGTIFSSYVGGIAGSHGGELISHCLNAGNIAGGTNLGGIVGVQTTGFTKNSANSINMCLNIGVVEGLWWWIGGIVGESILKTRQLLLIV
jgi:hypothetical protein